MKLPWIIRLTAWLCGVSIQRVELRNDSGGCLHQFDESAAYLCKCHERMGNDFWFLPTGECVYRKASA